MRHGKYCRKAVTKGGRIMKKIIFIVGGIFCILAFLIFMAQTCQQEGAVSGYPSYVGDWSVIFENGQGPRMKVDMSLTENNFEMDMYQEGASWDYYLGVKGTLTVNEDNFTMAVNKGRLPIDGTLTEWFGWEYYGGEAFYYLLTYMIHTNYYYNYGNFNDYAAWQYYVNGTYPELNGKFAITNTGNTLILYYEIWGTNYFSSYHSGFNPDFTPHEGFAFTRVQ
jgi:hypothetical protein